MKKINLLILMLFVSIFVSNAQTTIITDDSTYTSSSFNAIMEVHSANGNKGILIPRLTTAERTAISTSATNDISLLVYDTDAQTFWYFDGSAWVEIATGGTVTDDQLLTFSNDTLYIENGNSVYLGDYMELPATAVNGQVLTWNGTNWVAQNAASGADNWGTQVVVSDATLTGDGTSGTPLGVVGDLTDDQTLSLNSNTLSISGGNSVDLSGYVNTDNQNLSLSGNTLNITNGTGVDLSAFMDNTDNQALSLSGNTLSLVNGGSVDLSGYVNTDNQNLSLSGNTLNITNGTGVDLSAFMDNTDNQTLSLSGNTLSISGGNSVDLSGYGNDWKLSGNSATSSNFIGTTNNTDFKIRTNNTERMTVEASGNVGIGTTSPGYPLTVTSATAARTGSFINTEASTDNYAVYGECASTDYYGYGGYFKGGYKGVYATVSPTGSNIYYGLQAEVSGGSGTNYGVYGYSSTSGDARGVYGYASSTGTGWNYGVYGYSSASSGVPIGVRGSVNDADGYGILGSNGDASGTGIVAIGNNLSNFSYPTNGGGIAANGDLIGVFGYGQNTGDDVWGGYFSAVNNSQFAYVGGQFSGTNYKINGTGSVSTIVKRNDGTRANMFCPEAPEILFQDYGVGKLVNGKAHIDLDPILTKNIVVNNSHPLRVFIQLEGDCKGVYVTNKTQTGFDVVELQNGSSNVNFSWTIVANRADEFDDNGNRISKNADVRFPDGPGPMSTKTSKVQYEKENVGKKVKVGNVINGKK